MEPATAGCNSTERILPPLCSTGRYCPRRRSCKSPSRSEDSSGRRTQSFSGMAGSARACRPSSFESCAIVSRARVLSHSSAISSHRLAEKPRNLPCGPSFNREGAISPGSRTTIGKRTRALPSRLTAQAVLTGPCPFTRLDNHIASLPSGKSRG